MDEKQEIEEIKEIKLKELSRQKQTCKKQDAYYWFNAGVVAERFADKPLVGKKILRDFNFKWKNIVG